MQLFVLFSFLPSTTHTPHDDAHACTTNTYTQLHTLASSFGVSLLDAACSPRLNHQKHDLFLFITKCTVLFAVIFATFLPTRTHTQTFTWLWGVVLFLLPLGSDAFHRPRPHSSVANRNTFEYWRQALNHRSAPSGSVTCHCCLSHAVSFFYAFFVCFFAETAFKCTQNQIKPYNKTTSNCESGLQKESKKLF